MAEYKTVPIKGCKGNCDKWHTIKYSGRHNIVNAFADGKVACSTCEVMFDKSYLKSKKHCLCCGRQVRFKAVTKTYNKSLEQEINCV